MVLKQKIEIKDIAAVTVEALKRYEAGKRKYSLLDVRGFMGTARAQIGR